MGVIGPIVAFGAAAFSAAVASFRWPMLAVFLFLVLTLTNAPAVLVHTHGLPSVGALLVPALATLLVVRTALRLEQPATAVLLAPFVGFLFLATALRIPWVENTEATVFVTVELGKNLLILLVLIGFLTSVDRIHWAARAVTVAIGGLAVPSVFQTVTGRYDQTFLGFANAAYLHIEGQTQGWRLIGPNLDPNFFAQLLLAALPIVLILVIVEKRLLWRLLALGVALATLISIVQTYSRGALLALVVVALAAAFLSRSRVYFLPASLVGLVLVILVGPAASIERAMSGLGTASLLSGDANIIGDPAVIQRISVMRAAVRMFMEHPLLGVGPGQFATQYPDYALRFGLDMDAPAAAHNLYLEIAAEQGLLGLILFAVFIGGPLVYAGRKLVVFHNILPARDTYLLRAMVLGIIGYLAAAMFLHDAYPRFFWVFMALLVATLAATNGAFVTRTSLSRSSEMPEQSQENAASSTSDGPANIQSELLTVLSQRRVPILLGALVFAGLTALQVAQTPVMYSTDAKLIYRFGREYFPITPAEVRRNWGENIIVSLDNALATELHLLSSHEVRVMALDRMGDATDALGTPTAGVAVPKTAQAAALASLLEIRRIQGTTMLGVRLKHSDPEMAEQLLQTYIAAYMERRDTLFHADASGYFESQYEALKARDEAVQAELTRLRFERSELAAVGNVTQWSPDLPRTQETVDMAQVTRQIQWIDGLIDQQEKRSDMFRTRLLELEGERQDWEMSRAYSEQVGLNVEIADQTPVTKISSLSGSVIRVLSAAIGGAILVWIGAFLLHFSRRSGGKANAPAGTGRSTRKQPENSLFIRSRNQERP